MSPAGPRRLRLPSSRRAQVTRDIKASGLFDAEWYATAYGAQGSADLLIRDYVVQGRRIGRRPRPYFDPAWYAAAYPDVAAARMDAFHHYVRYGHAEGRRPSPWFTSGESAPRVSALFDEEYYAEQNPDVVAQRLDPLAHFLEWGARELRDPNALFASGWYWQQNPDVLEAGRLPADHYLDAGWREGRDPHPLFDTAWYRARYDLPENVDPLAHFLTEGYQRGYVTRPADEPCAWVPDLVRTSSWFDALSNRVGERLPTSLAGWAGPAFELPTQRDALGLSADAVVRTEPRRVLSASSVARRALLISHEASLTGAPIYLEQCGRALVGAGFEVLVVSLREDMTSEVFTRAGLPAVLLRDAAPGSSPTGINWILTEVGAGALGGIVEGFAPDVAVINSIVAADAFGPLARRGLPVVLQVHETFGWPGPAKAYAHPYFRSIRRALQGADDVLFGSQESQDLWQVPGCEPRGSVLTTTRVPGRAPAPERIAELRRELGITESDTVLLSVATFEPRKRILDIVEAFSELEATGVVLLLVGDSGAGGELRDRIADVREGGRRIITLSPRSGVEDYYALADALILASEQETFPLVLQEAALARTPRIVSRFAGWQESVSPASALTFEVGDTAALADHLARVIDDPAEMSRIGDAGWAEADVAGRDWERTFLDAVDVVMRRPRASVLPREWL